MSVPWSGSRWTVWFPKAHSTLQYITSIGLCFNKSIVWIIISRKSKRKLKENMTLRLTLELQTFLSLKRDTLPRLLHPAPIKRNLKIKQDTSALQTSSKLPFQSRQETQGLLFSSYSFLSARRHSLRAKQQLPPSLQGVMESGTCVLPPTFQGAEH